MNKRLIERLKSMNACSTGIEYINNQSALEAWNNCQDGSHMLWIAKKQGVDLKILTLARVRCARFVEHLMKDKRSIDALEVAENFAKGIATLEELMAAAASAAAAAADYAADYAASADYASAADYAAASSASAVCAAVGAADYAADYAVAAADYAAAAAAAAREGIMKKCADICRKTIHFDLLNLSNY